MRLVGRGLMGVGFIVGAVVWIMTSVLLFADGKTLLGVLALLVPPADLVLPWLISPALGIASLAALAVLLLGGVLDSLAEDRSQQDEIVISPHRWDPNPEINVFNMLAHDQGLTPEEYARLLRSSRHDEAPDQGPAAGDDSQR